MRANQMVRRARYNAAIIQVDELAACQQLAHDLFGARGVVEFDCDEITNKRTGALEIGYWIDPPVLMANGRPRPDPRRRRIFLFKGASHRELVDQIQLWRSLGGNS